MALLPLFRRAPNAFGRAVRRLSYPAHTLVPMPALSPTMQQGNLASWKVKAGDEISSGDVIAEVETDKATVDFDTQDDGFIAKILMPEGSQDVPVGTPVAVIVDDASLVDAFKDFVAGAATAPATSAPPAAAAAAPTAAPAAASPAAPAAVSAAPASASAVTRSEGAAVPASPLAKRLAAQMGIGLSSVPGSGPGGRVLAADVSGFVPKAKAAAEPTAAPVLPPPGAAYVDIPHSNIRKVTATRMLENKNGAPHYYVSMEICMDELVAMRKKLNEALGSKISVNDFIIKACAKALEEVPICNSQWTSDCIRQFSNADISVAVNTEKGLLTPIVFDAGHKSVAEISKDVKTLAGKAKENKLQPAEFIGGTFTVSNLGMFGVKQFTAIINSPQACILAVGGTDKKVVPNEGADAASRPFVAKSVMTVTLSSDHRHVDGVLAATWLQSFQKHMENPLLLMV